MEGALPLTPERFELIKACAGSRSHADAVATSRIAQRFAPRPPAVPSGAESQAAAQAPPTAPFFALAAGIKRLTAVLVVAALLPNLTLAAFWLRAIDMPWSKQAPAAEAGAPAPAQVALPPPVLSAPSTLQASAGEHVNFPIALDGTDAVPPGSVVVISGLPPGSRLSTGDRRGGTEWALKPDEIGDLHLVLPTFAVGESKLTIQLVAPGDRVVADASTMLSLIRDRDIAEADVTAIPDAAEPQSPDTEAEATEAAAQDVTASIDAAPASADAASAASEVVPLPTRRPEPPKSDAADANWIRPTAYVNLRDAPSPSGAVLGVVAKGAKLRVASRKRGWVEIEDPATSKTGWIYAGNAGTAAAR
jgi:hypothetical protein